MMEQPIILIGPMGAGKSTIARLLAARLGMPRCEMDEVRWDYYREIGYDEAEAQRIAEQEGQTGLFRYWKPFEAHAVERVLDDYQGCVIDFGAGHTVYEDGALFERVRAALAPYRNVILLLPSPDEQESLAILNARAEAVIREDLGQPLPPEVMREVFALNEHLLTHPSNHTLATMIIYTVGQTPEETCEEIVRRLSG